ncbi:hypothetical protein ACJMK2_016872 [Sinanodonta woodiana]|uniref:RING-type domain-containing protein n=1 Tax=Sinanodonta woodiana TaxID=1069815 RepID=A0ABD3UV29_SINWO
MAEAPANERKQWHCPLCLEPFKSPKSLPCMHTFCEMCIYKYMSDLTRNGTQPGTILCPVCRMHYRNPAANESPIEWGVTPPNNLAMLSGTALYSGHQYFPMYCQRCIAYGIQHQSAAFCFTCSEYLCQICFICHQRFSATSGHQISLSSALEYQLANAMQPAMYQYQNYNKN